MSDLMRIPPSDSRLARTGKSLVAGGLVLIVAVIALSFIIHAILVFLYTAAAVALIALIVWFFLFRRKR